MDHRAADAAGRRGPHDQWPVQSRPDPRSASLTSSHNPRATSQANRELAGGGRQRQRAAAQRPHDSGGHEHRTPALGFLRAQGGVARARQRRQWREHVHRRRLADEPLLRRRRTISNANQGVPPSTLFADRRNNIDFRFSKIMRYGRTRTQVGLDIYNATNTDVVTGYNETFVPGGSWLTPTGIQPARYVRANVQFDF